MTFDEAFDMLLGHEGGLSRDPTDRGGVTKYGISQASYPEEDIPNLTRARAKEIAFRDFWEKAQCPVFPVALRFDLFDMAYNSGPSAAIKTMQRALRVVEDGSVGPKTLFAASFYRSELTLARFNGARLLYMTNAPTWRYHGRGWAVRVAENLLRLP